jgi:transcriptional regulator with XRE-family HTH domain
MQNLTPNQTHLHNQITIGLRKLRESKNLTVYQLSKLSGVPEIRIHAIEGGQVNFTTKYLVKLIDALNAYIIINS